MSDDRLREILSVRVAADEEASRSERARKRAMAAYETAPRQHRWQPFMAAAALAIVLAGTWITQRSSGRPGAADASAERPRIEMRMQLSDGTRVNWVIDNRYAL